MLSQGKVHRLISDNMAKHSQSKGALAGLRCMQKIGALAVPTSLEQVTEEVGEKETQKPQIFSTDDWKSVEISVKDVFRNNFSLEEAGRLYEVQQSIKNILRSRTGTFLSDCYKEWLITEMNTMARKLKGLEGSDLLDRLEESWTPFYADKLPLLEAMLYLMKPKGRLTVRSMTLAVYRDVILFSEDIEGAISEEINSIRDEIRHLILVLQSVNDSYPPSKNKLRLESITAQILPRFLGYFGLYENSELVVTSNEPAAVARRKSNADVGPRRISRPFSVQPQQMETLNQMFKKALRHKSDKMSRLKE